jgi:MoxR-like ATPase
MKLSRAKALLAGRDFVTPDDVKSVTVAALSHRLTLRPELWVRRVTGEQVVQRVVDRVPTPVTQDAAPAPATEEDAAAG